MKITNTRYIFFEFNYRYYLYIFYKNNINSCLRSKLVNKLAIKLRNMITTY